MGQRNGVGNMWKGEGGHREEGAEHGEGCGGGEGGR